MKKTKYDELSMPEIAKALGISINDVRSATRTAQQKIQRAAARKGISPMDIGLRPSNHWDKMGD